MTGDDDMETRGKEPGAHVSERLDAYRTGELDEAGRARVETHLAACDRCREELAALASWTSAIERGYAVRRAESAGHEPDWAAQRAAIVARTSGRSGGREERWAFRRWAPQIALVAVAALIVGIVWRENPREPKSDAVDARAPAEDERAAGEERFARDDPAALQKEAGREALADRAVEPERVAEPPAAPQANAPALENPMAEAVPLGAALADVQRFEREARAALEARDTTAARRALALWSDTLSARGDTLVEPDGPAAAVSLADSLRGFLETAE